jgi:hypothetical protein
MKKDQVRVGNLYTAKVSGGIAQVKITDERWLGDKHAGWKGVNTATGRAVTIKSAQRLRAAVGDSPNSGDVAPSGEAKPEVVAAAGSPRPPKAGASKAAPKAKGAKPKAAKADAPKKAADKKGNGPMSGLDAAAKILADGKEPMNCKELVAEAFKKKYWSSEGATPEATLSAAIGREIRAKGADSRFKKAGRGMFAAAGKGA